MANETDGSSTQFVVGIIFSVLSIVVPAFLWSSGIYPSLSFGFMIGAAVRFGTDMVMLATISNHGAEGMEKFKPKHVPVAAGLVILQFGTLIGAAIWTVLGGPAWTLGIVMGMLAAYLFGLLSYMVFSSDDGGDSEVVVESEDGESEWRFDVDDLD